MLRPFTIQDLALWQSASSRPVFLHPQSLLTQGSGAILRGALLSPLLGISGIFTYVHHSDGAQGLLGQVSHRLGSAIAHCRFLAPEDALNSNALSYLLEGLLKQVGSRGAHTLVAEVDEDSPAFAALRQAGFSIYAHQQIWKLDQAPHVPDGPSMWRPALARDELAVQLLRNALIPGQVQQIEATKESLDGYVLRREEQLLAYVEVNRGPRGVWVQPFVSLDAEPFDDALADLLARLRPRMRKPVYVCLRSYQDWLHRPLEEFRAAGLRQAVMAKRTTMPLKAEEARRIPVANRSAEPTTPIHIPQIRRESEWIKND